VGCEREPFALGQFARIWPHLLEPVGRVHFVGAAYDSLWRGMEAATRSAERAAQTIHLA
jgi:monoamine oxidase